jgi:hypothetical protein
MMANGKDSFGKITVTETGDLWLRLPGETAKKKFPRCVYTWRPPASLGERQLPPSFELPLQCVTEADGCRRFFPSTGFALFLAQASTGGLAILNKLKNLDANQRHSYRAMRMIFLRVHHMTEHFRHRFDSSRDLSIARSGRTEKDEKDILPEDFGPRCSRERKPLECKGVD